MANERKIFITYGNSAYSESTLRLKKMAEECGQFDEIIIYTEKDLPDYIINHELMAYKRGGGYWLWKPYVTLKTLENCGDNDIVVYSDAGNEVFPHKEWNQYWEILKHKSAIFFKFGGVMEKWTRSNLLQYFIDKGVKTIRKEYQIGAALSIYRKSALPIVKEWLDVMISHPEFVLDVTEDQKSSEKKCLIENRHDQSVLSGAVYENYKQYNAAIMWQHAAYLDPDGQAVFNARISNDARRSSTSYEKRYRIWVRKVNNLLRDLRITLIRLFS